MERLEQYGIFSKETLRAVADAARTQATFKSYHDYFDAIGMPKPELFIGSKRRGVPVVDIPSRQTTTEGVIVVHLPVSNPLDENQLFHIATIASALPAYRVIGFGNPSGKPYKYRAHNRSIGQLLAIAFSKQPKSLVVPEIEYLHAQNITSAHHIGYSFGAHKALIEATYLQGEVASLLLVDPVAHTRGARQLLGDVRRSLGSLEGYVQRTGMQIYFDARRDTAETGHFAGAFRRPISIAIGALLARYDVMTNLKELLRNSPKTNVTVAWGSKSELGNDAHVTATMHQLKHDFPGRVHSMRFEGEVHAMANDVYLYAAIVRESIRQCII